MPWRDWSYAVNPSSGGGRGGGILRQLLDLVGEQRVLNLLAVDLVVQVRRWAVDQRPVIVIGGDGSVTGVLAALADAGVALPVGVLPLGTGNDLARALGMQSWSSSGLAAALGRLEQADQCTIDRWHLQGPGVDACWFNYCSIGSDARIAALFDTFRRRHPAWFCSSTVNRCWYALLALMQPGHAVAQDLAGPVACRLPSSVRSLVMANIDSYAGGSRLSERIAASDGRLDLLALPAGLALANRLCGRRTPLHLGQVAELVLDLRRATWMQIDGEPRRCPAGRYGIAWAGRVPVLALSGRSARLHPTGCS